MISRVGQEAGLQLGSGADQLPAPSRRMFWSIYWLIDFPKMFNFWSWSLGWGRTKLQLGSGADQLPAPCRKTFWSLNDFPKMFSLCSWSLGWGRTKLQLGGSGVQLGSGQTRFLYQALVCVFSLDTFHHFIALNNSFVSFSWFTSVINLNVNTNNYSLVETMQ